ncbi:MAG TPA: CUAEP/CCAEP-tail radical SAM protein, partial [Ktedonobacterales bacterium]|nr:CUAEP/CCAEP-tail radical SAM protein [Ktedonobacterales bacterium]
MRLAEPGAILLVSTYELGHQPLSLAAPLAHLARAGYAPAAADTAVAALPDAAIQRARLVAVAVPMHTALRLGARVVERVRALNPGAVIALYGLYAWLNGDHLLSAGADAVIAGDAEAPLVALAQALEQREGDWSAAPLPGVRTRAHAAAPLPRFRPEAA